MAHTSDAARLFCIRPKSSCCSPYAEMRQDIEAGWVSAVQPTAGGRLRVLAAHLPGTQKASLMGGCFVLSAVWSLWVWLRGPETTETIVTT